MITIKKIGARVAYYLAPLLVFTLFFLIIYHKGFLLWILERLFPDAAAHLYDRLTMAVLFHDHITLVIVSSVAATIVGVGLGIIATRSWGREFLPLMRNLSSLTQTFPPVAVLALITPLLGFGQNPTFVALFLFGSLPILNNTISGILEVPREVLESSRGMGMSRQKILYLVELPLAARIISVGIRVSVIINVGTATIGAVIGAGGFGVIIIAGLARDNPAYIFSGAIACSLLAWLLNFLLQQIERRFYQARRSIQ